MINWESWLQSKCEMKLVLKWQIYAIFLSNLFDCLIQIAFITKKWSLVVVSGSDWSIVRFILKYFRGSSLTNDNKTLSRSLNVHEVDLHGDILVHWKFELQSQPKSQSLYLLININIIIMWSNCQKFTIWWKLDQWNRFTSSISSLLFDIAIFWND